MNCISIIYIWKELNEKYEFEKLSTGRLTQVYMFNILYIYYNIQIKLYL